MREPSVKDWEIQVAESGCAMTNFIKPHTFSINSDKIIHFQEIGSG
jgi:hypothetical protein